VRLPDWLSSGVFPAQEDRCPPVRKRVMSVPVVRHEVAHLE
jgi:hypothetical protein